MESSSPIVRSGGEDGLRVGASPSLGDFASEEGSLLPAVVAANGGASAVDWCPHGHRAMVGKASPASVGNAEINGAVRFFGARSDQLGKKQLESRLDALVAAHDNGSLAYRQSATESAGTTMNQDALDGEGQELEEGEIAADTVEIAQGMMKNDDPSRPMEDQELEEGEIPATMDSEEAMNKDFLDGPVPVEDQLEEGEIAPSPTMDIVRVMVKEDLDGPDELEEGEIATTMDTVLSTNKDATYGSLESQELEEGEIAPSPTMDIVEAMNQEDTYDGAVEDQEFVEGVIAATRGVVESADDEASVIGAVKVQEFEEDVIAATMDVVESIHSRALDGVVVVQEVEDSEIAAMDVLESRDKDTLDRPVEDRESESRIAAKGHGQEPDVGEIAAKGHGQKLGDGEIATESDRIVQQTVNVIPCGSIGGIMRSKIRITPRKTVRPPVTANNLSQLVTLDKPFSTTTATMKKFKEAQTKPLKANHTMSQLAPQDKPFSTTTATMKKLKAAETKSVPINLAFSSASASKEKRKFRCVFITKEKLKSKTAVYLEDDDILKAVAVHEGKLELCLRPPSCVLPVSCLKQQGGGQHANPRCRVRMMCRRFEFLCRLLAQAVKQRSMELRRVDLAADQVIKKLPDYVKHRSIVGEVPGVEVGDEFLFRVEMAIVGIHSPYRAGIHTTKDTDGEHIAVSIVASGGYLDEFSSSGDFVYTGSGGKAAGSDLKGDQTLQRGNLALKNCIKREIPVRVTHGFKSQT